MQPEKVTNNWPHKNVIFLGDSVSGSYRVLETKDLFLPVTGAVLLNNVLTNTTSSTLDASNYNQTTIFLETTGTPLIVLTGVTQVLAPSNNWITLDRIPFSVSTGIYKTYTDHVLGQLRVLTTGHISGSMTASISMRRI